MSALQKEYENLRSKHPDAVIWFSICDFIESFSDCAIKTSDVLKTVLTYRPDNGLPLTGFPLSLLDKNVKKMIKSGYKVVLVESDYIKRTKKQSNK